MSAQCGEWSFAFLLTSLWTSASGLHQLPLTGSWYPRFPVYPSTRWAPMVPGPTKYLGSQAFSLPQHQASLPGSFPVSVISMDEGSRPVQVTSYCQLSQAPGWLPTKPNSCQVSTDPDARPTPVFSCF